jgi:hypothetical protein
MQRPSAASLGLLGAVHKRSLKAVEKAVAKLWEKLWKSCKSCGSCGGSCGHPLKFPPKPMELPTDGSLLEAFQEKRFEIKEAE